MELRNTRVLHSVFYHMQELKKHSPVKDRRASVDSMVFFMMCMHMKYR